MIAEGQQEDAVLLLKKGLAEYPGNEGLVSTLDKAIGGEAESGTSS